MTTVNDSLLNIELTDLKDEQVITNLVQLLEIRIQKKDLLQKDIYQKQNDFRNMLIELERENELLRYYNNEQKKMISSLEGRVCKLQNQIDNLLYKLNSSCDALRNMHQELEDRDRQLKQYAMDKQRIIQKCNAKIQDKIDRMSEELRTRLNEQRELLMSYVRKKDEKIRLVKQILMSRKSASDNVTSMPPIASTSRTEISNGSMPMIFEKKTPVVTLVDPQTFKKSRQTLPFHKRFNSDDIQGKTAEESIPRLSEEKCMMTLNNTNQVFKDPCGQISSTSTNSDGIQEKPTTESIPMSSEEKTRNTTNEIAIEPISMKSVSLPVSIVASNTADINVKLQEKSKDKIPVVNPRYWRCQSANKWIDHRPTRIVPTGTIMQMQTQPYKRTVWKLTNPKDFAERSTRYSLLSQEQDTDGQLETKLYKADVLPTCGGGAQIVFKDVECLKQVSPITTKRHDRQIIGN